MTQKYYSIMTTVGTAYINEQVLNDSEQIFADGWYIKLGNGTAEPDANMTDLSNVIYTKTAADYPQITFGQNPDGHYAEMLLPESLAGQLITEAGLFNADDVLIAVAKTKIDLTENGSGLEMSVKQRIYISAVPASVNVIYMAQSDLVTEDFLNETLTAYEPIAKVISKGSASLPVYFDSNGEAKTISSYQGNAATATTAQYALSAEKAISDGNNRAIDATYATRDLGGLTADGIDFINQSKGLVTGNVSSNAVAFADILSRLHSSFDLSKFTVVGNPTVTSDGIVSNTGVNKGCLINCPEIINNSFNISYDIKYQGAVSSSAYVMIAENSQFGLFLDAYALRVELKTSLSGQNIIIYETVLNLVTAHSYNINLSFNASSLEFKVKVTDKTNLANSGERTYILNRLFTSSYVKLYGVWSNSPNITYDLKSFSVKVNGVEVFSGNKTGVDSYTIDGNTVTIPYTITKGGAKIADMQYLDRVQEVYNQGYTDYQYFTIDEENKQFTLPQGMSVYEGIANNTALIKANSALIENNTADIALKADKTAVTTMVMPDYANGIAISANADFSAPDNGFISFVPINNTSDVGSVNIEIAGRIEIGGYTVLQATYVHGADHSHVDSGFFVVSKNQTVFHTMSAGTVYFYPCKGDV